MTTTKTALPDQPDGIDEYTTDLPDPVRAAERVRQYICANGDGMYDEIDGNPLYARDLEAVCRLVLCLTTERDDIAAELEKVRAELAEYAADNRRVVAQLTAANRRADGLDNDLRSATEANTAWANQDAKLRKAALTYRDAMVGQHEWAGHLIEGDCPDCTKAADQLDGALACDQYREWQRQYEDALSTYLPAEVAR